MSSSGPERQSPARTLVERFRAPTDVLDAGVEPTVALDSQAGSVQLGVPPQNNKVEGIPGGRPTAEVQRVQPEPLEHSDYVVVAHDDTPWRLPQPLRWGQRQGGSRGWCLSAVALNSRVPSCGCHSVPHGGMR